MKADRFKVLVDHLLSGRKIQTPNGNNYRIKDNKLVLTIGTTYDDSNCMGPADGISLKDIKRLGLKKKTVKVELKKIEKLEKELAELKAAAGR